MDLIYFLLGLFIGRFTNLFSNIIIGGIVLYFEKPDFYTRENMIFLKEVLLNFTRS